MENLTFQYTVIKNKISIVNLLNNYIPLKILRLNSTGPGGVGVPYYYYPHACLLVLDEKYNVFNIIEATRIYLADDTDGLHISLYNKPLLIREKEALKKIGVYFEGVNSSGVYIQVPFATYKSKWLICRLIEQEQQI